MENYQKLFQSSVTNFQRVNLQNLDQILFIHDWYSTFVKLALAFKMWAQQGKSKNTSKSRKIQRLFINARNWSHTLNILNGSKKLIEKLIVREICWVNGSCNIFPIDHPITWLHLMIASPYSITCPPVVPPLLSSYL